MGATRVAGKGFGDVGERMFLAGVCLDLEKDPELRGTEETE